MTDAKQDKPGQVDAPLVAALRDEVQFLRSQLQVRDEEIRRVHVLLLQEKQRSAGLIEKNEHKKDVNEDELKPGDSRTISFLKRYNSLKPVENAFISLYGYTIVALGAAWASLTNDDKHDISLIIINRIKWMSIIAVAFVCLKTFREFWERSNKYSTKLSDVSAVFIVTLIWIFVSAYGLAYYITRIPTLFSEIIVVIEEGRNSSVEAKPNTQPPASQDDKSRPDDLPPPY